MTKAITTILLLLVFCKVNAQDIHFTQFFATPMFTNPAFTGHFEGTYRFSGIIRNQWASVSPQPFRTFGGGLDLNAPMNIKPIGIGFHIAQDQAGLSSLTTTQLHGFLAGRVSISSKLKLHLGATAGIFQQSIDFSQLSFGDQYNGIRYDPGQSTTDVNNTQPGLSKVNAGAGIFLERKTDERNRVGVGFSIFNVTEPDRSFYSNTVNPLLRRNNIHLLSSIQLHSKWDLMPAVQFMQQGNQNEFLLGSSVRYHLNTGKVNPQSVQLGFWGRPEDAANISVGFQMNSLYIGGAYDVNLSTLKPATNYRGGWEFAVIYTIATVQEKVKRLRQCPDYL
ncbi:MAG: PorP/SprF family type IX secretion system membrane protein [Salibacteraceae bacterium]